MDGTFVLPRLAGFQYSLAKNSARSCTAEKFFKKLFHRPSSRAYITLDDL
ncbi:MAG: hypothetical protein IKI31_07170 [Treponema sp.]|nr:hypothetical protein [Treponema sp.]